MKTLNTVTRVLSKIIEVTAWITAVCSVIGFFACLFASVPTLEAAVGELTTDADLTAMGISMAANGSIAHLRGFLVAATIMGAILSVLGAMIFRNVYLIIKTSECKTWFSKGATPFQPDIVRMLREIGIFTIAIPAVELVFSVILRLIGGADTVEISVNLNHILMGLLVLWLTQAFTYGSELEGDAEGLI